MNFGIYKKYYKIFKINTLISAKKKRPQRVRFSIKKFLFKPEFKYAMQCHQLQPKQLL
jgi:hypothetical protein